MNTSLSGKVALVTGGSRGLGVTIARTLAEAGANVGITYRSSAAEAAEVVKTLEGIGVQAAAFQVDHADTAQAPQLIEDVVARFGGLDILVNNAAVNVMPPLPVDHPDVDLKALDQMHATNYLGAIATIRAAAKVLRDHGRIVSISSGIAGRAGMPGLADYAATKSGLTGYSGGVARDLAPRDITVNVVQAGVMATEMAPTDPATIAAMVSTLSIKRFAEVSEVADAVAFLTNPAASYITGAVLDSSGGYLA